VSELPSASATRGVIAVEKPIPKDIATKTKLFPNETDASSVVPNCPTIMLSISWTNVCPNNPNMTGKAKLKFFLNSLVYDFNNFKIKD
jgi:hypothetical protein